MQIIAIAGGSGSGKSTVSYRFVDNYPDIFEILNLDDYQKFKNSPELPMINGMVNWDHPDIIRWSDLFKDIKILQTGIPVNIQVWSHRSNPNYFKHGKMIPRTILPKKVLIIEGYFALWNENLRKLFRRTYYLESDQSTIVKRRNKFTDPKYESEVLIPMHKKYIEPTKKFADYLLDVSTLKMTDVYKILEDDVKNKLMII